MTLNDYLTLPWTIIREEHADDGSYVALRIEELPGFVVAAESDSELESLFWDALSAFLNSYLEDGLSPPVPASVRTQVEHPAFARTREPHRPGAALFNELRSKATIPTVERDLAFA